MMSDSRRSNSSETKRYDLFGYLILPPHNWTSNHYDPIAEGRRSEG